MNTNNEREILDEKFPPNTKTVKPKVPTRESPKPESQDIPNKYPLNGSADIPDQRSVKKVITGNVVKKKRGFGKKLAETFMEDDTKSVGSYIFHDVLIPAAKSLICDVVGWGGFAEQLLFGSTRGARGGSRRNNGRDYTSYGSYYRQNDRERDKRSSRDISRVGRARHDFDEIVLETRGEAEEVLSHLVDLTVDYGMASVADLYDLVGITSSFTDNKYGWTELRNARPRRVRDGYLLELPRTELLD